jgi:uncharacterized DUF497 family protein
MLKFVWNKKKAAANKKKHKITFEDATAVFEDPRMMEFEDEEHSAAEPRYNALGLTTKGLLFVVFAEDKPGKIHIISARRAELWMEKYYEKES